MMFTSTAIQHGRTTAERALQGQRTLEDTGGACGDIGNGHHDHQYSVLCPPSSLAGQVATTSSIQ